MSAQPTYYARDGVVRKNPIRIEKPEGGTVITIGFPVCIMHECVGASSAETVAALMNAGEAALDPKPLLGDKTDVAALVRYAQSLEVKNTELIAIMNDVRRYLEYIVTGTFVGSGMPNEALSKIDAVIASAGAVTDGPDYIAINKCVQKSKTHNAKLLAALKEIETGLRNTGTFNGEWMTRITKQQAYEIARAATEGVA